MKAQRNAMLAKVHLARKQLALEEDSYRSLLQRVTGHASAGDCSGEQLEAVLTEFRRLGWAAKPSRRPHSSKPNVRMIYGVWKDLKPFLAVEHTDKALRAFVRRQTGKDAPDFLDGPEANKVLEGLKAWLARERRKAST